VAPLSAPPLAPRVVFQRQGTRRRRHRQVLEEPWRCDEARCWRRGAVRRVLGQERGHRRGGSDPPNFRGALTPRLAARGRPRRGRSPLVVTEERNHWQPVCWCSFRERRDLDSTCRMFATGHCESLVGWRTSGAAFGSRCSATCAAETDAVPAQHERERGDRGVRGPQKKVVIIAGPNGAGKTAFARAFLPKRVREGALGSGYG
jgi:hypothetical protein